tara:strand:+ start:1256 stop:1807 length:552 start_codon:yes stop_codon:yes gene_type:complete
MACELTKGRGLDCRNVMGGIKAVYFTQHEDATVAETAGAVSDLDLTTNLFKYTLPRGTGSFTETIQPSSENGTVFYEPSVSIRLHKLTVLDRNELKLLAQNRLLVFVQTNVKDDNGKDIIWCLGRTNGLELSAGTSASGAAFGDMNGYELTFSGAEEEPALYVQAYSSTPFDNAAFTVTIDDN